ncbi:MAG: hypothetical protein VX760_07240 [Actinomycetota bacterium]|nr:hypothetical protein [Actinomycetota bacterium]
MQKASAAISLVNDLRQSSAPVVLAHDRTLPVVDELADLFSGKGLKQGSTTEVRGTAAVSLAVALTVGITRSEGWVVAVGLPELGSSAAYDLGVQFRRWAFVDQPEDQAGEVIHALMGAVDLILVGPEVRLRASHGRKIAARMRERGTSIVTVGDAGRCNLQPSLRLRVNRTEWTGLGHGYGRLTSSKVEIELVNRGADSSPHRQLFWLPDGEGRLSVVDQDNEWTSQSEFCSRDKQKILADLDKQIPWAS